MTEPIKLWDDPGDPASFDGSISIAQREHEVRITFALDDKAQADLFYVELRRQLTAGKFVVDLGEKVSLS